MAWVRLDDGFAEHPKVLSVSVQARWAYITALCYVNRRLTDGVVPRTSLSALSITPKLAQELLNARLWDKHGDDYMIHDFLEYNMTKAEQAERREKRARAGQTGGQRSGEQRRSKSEANASSLLGESLPVASYIDEAKSNPKPKPNPNTHPSTKHESDSDLEDGLPVAVRELRDTVLMALPANRRYDVATMDECELLATDFAGSASAVTDAIAAIRRQGKVPWPGQIRQQITPAILEPKKPALPAFFDDPSVAPEWWKEHQAREKAAQ